MDYGVTGLTPREYERARANVRKLRRGLDAKSPGWRVCKVVTVWAGRPPPVVYLVTPTEARAVHACGSVDAVET